mgnify:CR=1 FL=1
MDEARRIGQETGAPARVFRDVLWSTTSGVSVGYEDDTDRPTAAAQVDKVYIGRVVTNRADNKNLYISTVELRHIGCRTYCGSATVVSTML